MKHEKQSEIKNWLKERKLEKTLNNISIIICGLALAYFAGHFIVFALTERSDITAQPNIDGVPMRNEAQMFNGYNQ